jgi:hypothetical protein
MTKLSDNKEVASSPLVAPLGTEDDHAYPLGLPGGNPNG